jgi:predicted nucleotide-binding protein
MKDALNAFLASIPNTDSILNKHSETVALFGYFLSEVIGESITPSAITRCYQAAHLQSPANTSDTMNKSGAFVKDKKGWVLKRDALARIKSLIPVGSSPASNGGDEVRRKKVMVVYGQDEETRCDMFSLLGFLKLEPIEWNEAVLRTGKASPYVGEILTAAFSMAQAFLVLMTPDEEVALRPELRKKTNDGDPAFQPRPNVILEAGMALATDENRTILVSTGTLRGMSDLDGRHVIRLNNSAERRNDLVQRLKVAGCDPNTNGTDWLKIGDFERFA